MVTQHIAKFHVPQHYCNIPQFHKLHKTRDLDNMALNLATDSRMGKNKTAQTIAVSKDKPINLLLHTML